MILANRSAGNIIHASYSALLLKPSNSPLANTLRCHSVHLLLLCLCLIIFLRPRIHSISFIVSLCRSSPPALVLNVLHPPVLSCSSPLYPLLPLQPSYSFHIHHIQLPLHLIHPFYFISSGNLAHSLTSSLLLLSILPSSFSPSPLPIPPPLSRLTTLCHS